MHNLTMTNLPPIEPYIQWVLHGDEVADLKDVPLSVKRLPELKEGLQAVLLETSPEDAKIKKYVLNYLSFLESETVIPFAPKLENLYHKDLVNRVESFKLFDPEEEHLRILDSTVFRIAHIGQALVENSYFMETFYERFFNMDLKDQLYIFKKQPSLEDYFKFETDLISRLLDSDRPVRCLLEDKEWIEAAGLEAVFHDVLLLGCGPLKEFLLIYGDQLGNVLHGLNEHKAANIWENCRFLTQYPKHPDIACAFLAQLLVNKKIQSKPLEFNHRQIQHAIQLLNSHPEGEVLAPLLLDPQSSGAILAQACFRIHQPQIPFRLPCFPLSTFLVHMERDFLKSRVDSTSLLPLRLPFPVEDFALLHRLERKFFIQNILLNPMHLLFLLEQQPDTLQEMLALFFQEFPDKKEHDSTVESIKKFLFEAPFHPATDFAKIFGALNIEIFSSLQSAIKKQSVHSWNWLSLLFLRRFARHLTAIEKIFILLNRSSKDQTYLYEEVRSCCLQENFQDVLPIFELLEQLDNKENLPRLLEILIKVGETDEIFNNLARSSKFKTLLITFGQDLLLQLYDKKILSANILFMFGQILPLPVFKTIAHESCENPTLVRFSKSLIPFNGQNLPVEIHLKNLLEAGHDPYTTHFLEILREKILGDGKFLIALCLYFPKELDYKKIFELVPSNFYLYAAHLLPDDVRGSITSFHFQPTILSGLPHMDPKTKQWYIEKYTSWIAPVIPPFDSLHQKIRALIEKETLEEKVELLEEMKSAISSFIAKQQSLLANIERCKRQEPDSPLIPLLEQEFNKNALHIAQYKELQSKIPDEPSLFCCISGAFMKHPVVIDQDPSEAIFDLFYLQQTLDKKGGVNKRARWPHLPSNFFTLEDILPVSEEKKGELAKLTTQFENAIQQFASQFLNASCSSS